MFPLRLSLASSGRPVLSAILWMLMIMFLVKQTGYVDKPGLLNIKSVLFKIKPFSILFQKDFVHKPIYYYVKYENKFLINNSDKYYISIYDIQYPYSYV